MAKYSKATEKDIALVVPRQTQRADYTKELDYLNTLKEGEKGVLEVEGEENERGAKSRLARAAGQKDWWLDWDKLADGRSLFTVRPIQQKPGFGRPKNPGTGRGRPKKAESAA